MITCYAYEAVNQKLKQRNRKQDIREWLPLGPGQVPNPRKTKGKEIEIPMNYTFDYQYTNHSSHYYKSKNYKPTEDKTAHKSKCQKFSGLVADKENVCVVPTKSLLEKRAFVVEEFPSSGFEECRARRARGGLPFV